MEIESIAHQWAADFGLALTPLFGRNDDSFAGSHHVLLDGGYGSFAISVADEEIWRQVKPTDWSWSSDLSHHVTVTPDQVAVVRWDKPNPEIFTRQSVESKRAEFYKYLNVDRVKSNRRVVPHMLEGYRKVRSLVANARLPDSHSTDAFLAMLAVAIERSTNESVQYLGASLPSFERGQSALSAIAETSRESLISFLLETDDIGRDLTLYPSLAMRHAGSEIFQEAHYELLRAPTPDLFDYVSPAESAIVSRGGAHFTPPSLARSLVEEVLRNSQNITSHRELVIMDPACGSGAFLHEALRALDRAGYEGNVHLIGRDVSEAAVAMAAFVLNLSKNDWPEPSKITLNLSISDSLETDLPDADLILMNPPFIAWSAMSSLQREQTSKILEGQSKGRGDLSMAFITKALASLKPEGVLGTLLPSSIFTTISAENWRQSITENNQVCFLGSLGEYGLFSYAMIQVGAMVIKSQAKSIEVENYTKVLTSNDSAEATSLALRNLRRSDLNGSNIYDEDFRLFNVKTTKIEEASIWRLLSPKTEEKLDRVSGRTGMSLVGNLFGVHKGVETGRNPSFIINDTALERLPKRERSWFRPAVTNSSISGGKLATSKYVFFPYKNAQLAITTEEDLFAKLPVFSKINLLPVKQQLLNRTSVEHWWALRRPLLALSSEKRPRILSKRFGNSGGFVFDKRGESVVVQAFSWIPKWTMDELGFDTANFDLESMLAAYTALFNSNAFQSLLGLYAPLVLGGQFDLGRRFVSQVPCPDLYIMSGDIRWGETISNLINLYKRMDVSSLNWQNDVNLVTNQLYGLDLLNLR